MDRITDGNLLYGKEELENLIRSVSRSNVWNIASAVYLQNFSIAAQETTPNGIFFKPDGTKMYVVGTTGDNVNEYDLGTPWDITTAVYLQLFSVAGQEANPKEIFFKPDGTKMYVVGTTGDDVNEYDLSTPWDITSAVYLHLFSVAGQETNPTGLFFKPDGTKMYVVGTTNDTIFEYDLDTTLGAPWNVQYADYLQYFSLTAQETSPQGLFFKPDGTKMYVIDNTGDNINEYDLSTPWDVTTAVYLQLFSVTAQETNPTGVFFKPDGTKMYVVGYSGDDINEYDLRSLNSILTFSGNVYSQTLKAADVTDDAKHAFTAGGKRLRDVVITNTHATENIVIGEDQADVATLRLEGYILNAGNSIGFTQVDLATLYFVTETNTEEPTVRLIGVEE